MASQWMEKGRPKKQVDRFEAMLKDLWGSVERLEAEGFVILSAGGWTLIFDEDGTLWGLERTKQIR